MFFIQGINSGTITTESTLDSDSEKDAIKAAKELANDPLFEGTCVRVLDIDSNLVYRKNFLKGKR